MGYNIKWLHEASTTYLDEIEFIFLKWNQRETENFIYLVDDNLNRLSVNPFIGKPIKSYYKLVISKQTTLYYKVIENKKRIDLLVFWNNSKSPDDLAKLL